MLSVAFFSFTLSVVLLSAIVLSVILQSVIMLSVIMLNVVMLSAAAPRSIKRPVIFFAKLFWDV
jgi:hypothetical protein